MISLSLSLQNVPPYGRAGLYLELANLKELVDDYRSSIPSGKVDMDLLGTIHGLAQRSGMLNDVPFAEAKSGEISKEGEDSLPDFVSAEEASEWISRLTDYLSILQDRLFSSGLHAFGCAPSDEELDSYLEAYFGDRISSEQRQVAISEARRAQEKGSKKPNLFDRVVETWQRAFQGEPDSEITESTLEESRLTHEASNIANLLSRSTEEIDSVLHGLDGGYVKPAPGGDLLRDGPSVLPTGRNIHALDPYRMPSPSAWIRGQKAADEIIRQHREANNGTYPETVAVTLWGLDSIKTRGESIAIVLALIGAEPIKEGTGRIVRYDLTPLERLGRPRVDVLASLSGIFR